MSFGDDLVPDKTLLTQVDEQLRQTGATTNVAATVSGGCVTLTGVLQYANQRRVVLQKATQVTGVRQVIDQMTVVAKKRVDQ